MDQVLTGVVLSVDMTATVQATANARDFALKRVAQN
jgi:hypothetical protein